MFVIIAMCLVFLVLNVKTSLMREEWEDADLEAPLPCYDTVLPSPRVQILIAQAQAEYRARVKEEADELILDALDTLSGWVKETKEVIRPSVLKDARDVMDNLGNCSDMEQFLQACELVNLCRTQVWAQSN